MNRMSGKATEKEAILNQTKQHNTRGRILCAPERCLLRLYLFLHVDELLF